MANWKTKKRHWQWFWIICYAGLIVWMGTEKIHRTHPALFFIALIGLTAMILVILRSLFRKENQVMNS